MNLKPYLRWFHLHVHVHSYVGTKGAHQYSECRCESRRSRRINGLLGPVDKDWLEGLEKDLHRGPPRRVLRPPGNRPWRG